MKIAQFAPIKKYMSGVLILLLLVAVIPTGFAAPENVISDENLKAAINVQFNRSPEKNVTIADMRNLTQLNASGKNIKSLDGIQYATNLKDLDLNNNSISSISPLGMLTKLEDLNLENNLITDIKPLKNMRHLEDLDLEKNLIKNINPLVNLTSLKELDISNNSISNISPLKKLTKLEDLDLKNQMIRVSVNTANFKFLNPLKDINGDNIIVSGDGVSMCCRNTNITVDRLPKDIPFIKEVEYNGRKTIFNGTLRAEKYVPPETPTPTPPPVKDCRVSYDLNGGTGAPAPSSIVVNQNTYVTIKKLPKNVTYSGKEFSGWLNEATRKEYTPGDLMNVGNVYQIILKAVWIDEKPNLPILNPDHADPSIQDVLILLQYTAGIGMYSDKNDEFMIGLGADLDNDGKIGIGDVLIFLKNI